MNKDTAREVLEIIRKYCQQADELDMLRLIPTNSEVIDAAKEKQQRVVNHFADLISFNT
jgi:hypothetical protein